MKETYKKKVRTLGKVTVTVTAKKAANTNSTPDVTPTQAPAITTAPTAAPTATPAPTPVVIYDNFFEDGRLNGFEENNSRIEVSNSVNHTDGGRNSLFITDRTKTTSGTQMDIAGQVTPGKQITFSAWVKQDSGSSQNIAMNLKYNDTSDVPHSDSVVANATNGIACESGVWTKLTGTVKIPESIGAILLSFELTTSATESFYLDDVVISGIPTGSSTYTVTNEVYSQMKTDSVRSTGNNARIKKVIEKARAGKDVTLAYIGGSITEGANASPNSKCYVSVSAKAFAEKYGVNGGSNVHCVNAGMSGTPSGLGVVRYDRDVIGQMTTGADHPDILFIEFAVNDYNEVTKGGAYEGLIRHALKSGSAVVLIFSVFQNGTVCQDSYVPYGKYYDLPMISMGDSISKYFSKKGFLRWFFSDVYHPNQTGYKLMSDCIMTLMDQIDNEDLKEDNITDIDSMKAKNTDIYENIGMLDSTSNSDTLDKVSNINAGSFTSTDNATGTFQYKDKNNQTRTWFPNNWMHKKGDGDTAFTATVNCNTLMIVYKLSSESTFGSADLYVDNVKKQTLNGYDSSGWNNGSLAVVENLPNGNHEIKIQMTDSNKSFTILAIGYNK